MIDGLCTPCKNKGRLVKATHIVGQTPMCDTCFIEAKQVPAVDEPKPQSALASLNQLESEARAAGKWRKRKQYSNGHKRVPAPAPTPRRVDKRTVIMPKEHEIDWVRVQNERSAGAKVRDLAAKYGVKPAEIHYRTNPAAKNGAGGRGVARTQVTTGSRPGRGYSGLLGELVEKRDKINAAIEAIEELGLA